MFTSTYNSNICHHIDQGSNTFSARGLVSTQPHMGYKCSGGGQGD